MSSPEPFRVPPTSLATAAVLVRCGPERSGGLAEFGAAEQQRVSGRELGQDAVQEVGAGQTADDGQDGSGVPAGGRGGGARAGGQVLDEAPAGERLVRRNLAGEVEGGLYGQTGSEFDAFVAGELAAQGRQHGARDVLGPL